MDETYIKVKGDRAGDSVDFLLTAKRDLAAARRFLERAINMHDVPEKITIGKSGANTAAIESVKADAFVDILMHPMQIPQQHRPAGLSSYQTNHPSDARIQVILERTNHHCRN